MTTRNDLTPCLGTLDLGRGPGLGGTIAVVAGSNGDGVDIVWTSPLRDKPITLRFNGIHSDMLCELITESLAEPLADSAPPAAMAAVIPLRRSR